MLNSLSIIVLVLFFAIYIGGIIFIARLRKKTEESKSKLISLFWVSKLLVKFKKLHLNATIPQTAHETDAGADLRAISVNTENDTVIYKTGIAIEIPEGYVGLIYPRSSISKYDLALSNAVGVIDSSFRGEILFKFKKIGEGKKIYQIGDKIGQLMIVPYPKIIYKEVLELSETERNNGGFGSTGA